MCEREREREREREGERERGGERGGEREGFPCTLTLKYTVFIKTALHHTRQKYFHANATRPEEAFSACNGTASGLHVMGQLQVCM